MGEGEEDGHSTRRSAWPPKSTTMARPAPSKAKPRGAEKPADAAKPSNAPTAPLPARVLTAPDVGFTTRMRKFPLSETHRSPVAGSSASPHGLLNNAAAPVPSAQPAAPDPAKLVTEREARSSLRIFWLFESAIKSVAPAESSATPKGALNPAKKRTPSALPVEKPASVLT